MNTNTSMSMSLAVLMTSIIMAFTLGTASVVMLDFPLMIGITALKGGRTYEIRKKRESVVIMIRRGHFINAAVMHRPGQGRQLDANQDEGNREKPRKQGPCVYAKFHLGSANFSSSDRHKLL